MNSHAQRRRLAGVETFGPRAREAVSVHVCVLLECFRGARPRGGVYVFLLKLISLRRPSSVAHVRVRSPSSSLLVGAHACV